MARKRSVRRGGRPGGGTTPGLFLFLLLCLCVLCFIVFFRQKESLMVLSNKTIYACDSLLKNLGHDPEAAVATVQQVNYDRNRPYTYLYRRFSTTNGGQEMKELKRGFQRVLAAVDQFRSVRILRYAETKEEGRTLWSFKMGMAKFVFYNLEFVEILAPRQAAGTNGGGEEYSGFQGEETGDFWFQTEKTQARKQPPKTRARIAVIIDDVGSEQERLTRKYLSFPGELTFAVFPGLSSVTADRAERINRIPRFDIIVHQPMEPEDRK